jgi:hypothetical protein
MSSKSWQGYEREAKNSIRGLKDGGGWASTNIFSSPANTHYHFSMAPRRCILFTRSIVSAWMHLFV